MRCTPFEPRPPLGVLPLLFRAASPLPPVPVAALPPPRRRGSASAPDFFSTTFRPESSE
jgi:hypothetical protein